MPGSKVAIWGMVIRVDDHPLPFIHSFIDVRTVPRRSAETNHPLVYYRECSPFQRRFVRPEEIYMTSQRRTNSRIHHISSSISPIESSQDFSFICSMFGFKFFKIQKMHQRITNIFSKGFIKFGHAF